ncbi:hypothetical protein QN372_01930 [Undibacterium sp. RTI2.1]|uniref:hypothetical protein n=1 Tax=unclassified Undibacterium TaxID=2630295 RepID=UPI002AB53AE1|nr:MULTISPECIES: hypothetical protein [unclassified Undibacterium]MDY7536837.1 hypothetical protein [Undibacterium sp. 5I1]MEB0029498.1 hypothetical protein [Undibacterium sp. RTI2.1]MEB0115684.1 hypothetical protein [Undibacterium sp. RTI2.2]MEB0231993.1 hypothetical protein [Undibacterium sp. 10I3]MEB0256719.1 hypothetical protein [Undibacterium sp. 5I1]
MVTIAPRCECKRYSDNCPFGELLGVVTPPSKMQLAFLSRLVSQSANGTILAVPMENLGKKRLSTREFINPPVKLKLVSCERYAIGDIPFYPSRYR